MAEFIAYNADGTVVGVEPWRWQWVAIYNDGTFLMQFEPGDPGVQHKFHEIDQPRLKVFRMIRHDGARYYDIRWEPYYKLVHFARHLDTYQLTGGPGGKITETDKVVVFFFGYEHHFHKDVKTLFCILSDDNLVIADDADKVLFDPS